MRVCANFRDIFHFNYVQFQFFLSLFSLLLAAEFRAIYGELVSCPEMTKCFQFYSKYDNITVIQQSSLNFNVSPSILENRNSTPITASAVAGYCSKESF